MQFLMLIALLRKDGDPLDVVLRQHRMLHRADLYMHDPVLYAPYRNMLLTRPVTGTDDELRHRLAAADHRDAAVLCF